MAVLLYTYLIILLFENEYSVPSWGQSSAVVSIWWALGLAMVSMPAQAFGAFLYVSLYQAALGTCTRGGSPWVLCGCGSKRCSMEIPYPLPRY